MHVVVLCYGDQVHKLPTLLFVLNAQLRVGDYAVVVSQNNNCVNTCTAAGVDHIQSNPSFTGFSAGYNRDLGASHLAAVRGKDDVLFLDGDCVPSPHLMLHHRSAHDVNEPVLACGLRVNVDESGKKTPDRRLGHPSTKSRLFVPGIDRLILDQKQILRHSVAWSCNMSANVKALDLIRASNTAIGSVSGRLFHSMFDGRWGGEDTGFALAGYRNRAKTIMLDPSRSWVTHTDHETSYQATDNLRLCSGLDKAVRATAKPSCRLRLRMLVDGSCPVHDTVTYYDNLELVEPDPLIVGVASALDVTSPSELAVLCSLFSPNPVHEHVPYTYKLTTCAVPVGRVLELYNAAVCSVFDATTTRSIQQ